MIKELFKYSMIIALLLFYLVYTYRCYRKFQQDVLFSRRLKRFHSVMFWLIPFLWIFIIKGFTKSTPGYPEAKDIKQPDPFYDTYRLE